MAASSTTPVPNKIRPSVTFLSVDLHTIPNKNNILIPFYLEYIYSPFFETVVSEKVSSEVFYFDIFDKHPDIKEKLLSDDIGKSEKYMIYCEFFTKIGVEYDVFIKKYATLMDSIIQIYKDAIKDGKLIQFSFEKMREITEDIVKKLTESNSYCYFLVYSDYNYPKLSTKLLPFLCFVEERFKPFDLNMFFDLCNLNFVCERPRNARMIDILEDRSFNFINFLKKFTHLPSKEIEFIRNIIKKNLNIIQTKKDNTITVDDSDVEYINRFLNIIYMKSSKLLTPRILFIHFIVIFTIVINNHLRKTINSITR